jgi:hypothetical protein
MNNSKITVKLQMNSLSKEEGVKQLTLKPYEIHYFIKHTLYNNSIIKPGLNITDIDDFRIERNIQNVILTGKINNNAMFFYDSRVINGIFIDISSKFNQSSYLNPLLDEFQLLKNHLRGQNFDSAFKILSIIQNFNQWIAAFFLIINKICHSPTNILLIKKHSLNSFMLYLKEKVFDDDTKTSSFNNIKILCLTSLLYRCLSIRQYEYAFLIAERLNLTYLYKIIVSHSKLSKYLGVSYLACNKLEVIY